MAQLQYLGIIKCKSLQECLGLDEVYTLEGLSLRSCTKLAGLPCLQQLTNLKRFNIGHCSSIRAVLGLNDMVALEEFSTACCFKLATLLDLVKLMKLQRLDKAYCLVREMLGLDGLTALTILDATFNELLEELPMLSKLSMLKDLGIWRCNEPIWTSISNLLMLETIYLLESKENMWCLISKI